MCPGPSVSLPQVIIKSLKIALDLGLETRFDANFPAAGMKEGDLSDVLGFDPPKIDVEKEIPTPFPAVIIKVALKAETLFPYQLMAGVAPSRDWPFS